MNNEKKQQLLIQAYDAVIHHYALEHIEERISLAFKMLMWIKEHSNISVSKEEILDFLVKTHREIYPVNAVVLTQCDIDIFKQTSISIQFAMYILNQSAQIKEKFIVDKAFTFVFDNADWEKISFDKSMKSAMYVQKYGAEEFDAMVDAGEIVL